MAGRPKITGIICTHNRERFLRRCILSLYDQTLNNRLFEIIVVDNGSQDGTQRICKEFGGRTNFRYLFEPEIGLSAARNTGWKHAQSDYIGYVDDDATADRTWFESALWSFENISPTPDWVGGPIELEWEVPGPDWITEEYQTVLGKLGYGDSYRFLSGRHERLGGGNSFYRREILTALCGFDTRLGRKKDLLLSGEETQFQHRIRAIGGRLFYHPGVRIFHFVTKERATPRFFCRRYFWNGRTDHIMNQTLDSIRYQAISPDKPDTATPFRRVLRNSLAALGGSASSRRRIHGRIYLAYVLGWAFQVCASRFQSCFFKRKQP